MQNEVVPNKPIRESNFELLRLVCMFCIIFYHIISFYVVKEKPEESFWRAIEIPFHIGVIDFVLISGYFGINPTIYGFLKIFFLGELLYFPLQTFNLIETQSLHGVKEILLNLSWISSGPYWFIRTYLYLYLLSPVINCFIDKKSEYSGLMYLLCVLGVICFYVGFVDINIFFIKSPHWSIQIGDPAFSNGKNILLFSFVYCFGRYLRINIKKFDVIKLRYLLIFFLMLNFLLVLIYLNSEKSAFGVRSLFFPYDSIGLVLNSSILFVIFYRLSFKNVVLNTFASSVFAMYLVHHHPYVLDNVLCPITKKICDLYSDKWLIMTHVSIETLLIMFVSSIVFFCN